MIRGEVTWSPGMTLYELEKLAIQKALQHYGNNKTHTAKALGIAIRTLDNKLAEYQRSEDTKAGVPNDLTKQQPITRS